MTLQARWSGTCPECGGRWKPGDFIRTDTEAGPPVWQHAHCPDDLTDPFLKPGEVACDQCWLVHQGECP